MLLSPLETPTEEHQSERRQEPEAAKQQHTLAWYRKLGGNVGLVTPTHLGGGGAGQHYLDCGGRGSIGKIPLFLSKMFINRTKFFCHS